MTTPPLLAAPTFFVKTILSQALAAAACVIVWQIIPLLSLTIATGTLVALASAVFLQLPLAWRLLNSVLPCAAAATLAITIPSAVYLLPLLMVTMTYAPALLTRVPYYPTQKPAYALILAELPVDRPFTFLDVGCGFGDLLFFLAKHRPNGNFVGIELGPLPFMVARLRAFKHTSRKPRILYRDMWRFPLANFDYVYTFLSPAAMERMWQKASDEMADGSTFITNSFAAPAQASEEIAIRDERRSKLYIYRRHQPKSAFSATIV